MIYLLTIMLAFAYRIRGGGFVSLDDFEYRSVWGVALSLSYLFLHPNTPDLIYAALLPLLSYVSLFIPHAYAQNMGRWPTSQNKWPSFFLPDFTQAEWTALPTPVRTFNDFIAMGAVAFFRGAIVFFPLLASDIYVYKENSLHSVILAVVTLVIGQPLAYLLGWYVPLNFPSLKAKSTEWCEFLNGAVYGVALWLQ